MKQHQHAGGPVNNSSAAGGSNGTADSGPAGTVSGRMGPTAGSDTPHGHSAGGAGGLAPPPRHCWSHQSPTSHPQHHYQHPLPAGRRAPDDGPSPPPSSHRGGDVVDDDDDDEPNKKPLHLLQLQTAMSRFSPPDHGHHHHHGGGAGGGSQLKIGGGGGGSIAMSYHRASPTSLHPAVAAPVRYHHHAQQHAGTPMSSPMHAWPDSEVDMLPGAGIQQQQQQRGQGAAPFSNQQSPYPGSAYMMTSSDMTSSYQSWYPGSAQQLQPAHHLPTLLS